jgi:hypothetical protein
MEYIRFENRRKSMGDNTLNINNNNSSIHQTRTRTHASARGREVPTDELMNCGISNSPQRMCWNCSFFEPSDPSWDLDQPPDDDCVHGECRFYPPVTDHEKRDASCNYAVFPIVIAGDWCGMFPPRQLPTGMQSQCGCQENAVSRIKPGPQE